MAATTTGPRGCLNFGPVRHTVTNPESGATLQLHQTSAGTHLWTIPSPTPTALLCFLLGNPTENRQKPSLEGFWAAQCVPMGALGEGSSDWCAGFIVFLDQSNGYTGVCSVN